MFFVRKLTYPIDLHPMFLNPNMNEYLRATLKEKVEGQCLGNDGYVIAVIRVGSGAPDEAFEGRVVEGSGQVQFNLEYLAIVYRPFRGEVTDGVVAKVNKMGFFADIGPISCFVSTHLIPSVYKYDPNANPPCYQELDAEHGALIQQGTKIRLKIVGTRIDATEIFAIGTIKEDHLGPRAHTTEAAA